MYTQYLLHPKFIYSHFYISQKQLNNTHNINLII